MTIEIRVAPIKAQALEVPRRIRAWVRARDAGTVVLAAAVGAVAGLVVTVMGEVVTTLHELLFMLEPGARLSAAEKISWIAALLVPSIGGLLRLAGLSINRVDRERLVDPIEGERCAAGGCRFAAA
jgi:CIC family chloride channel protein